jgi:hypothetical protein
MEGRKKMEEVYRKLKVGMKLKYAFTTVIVTFAVAMVVSLVSIVMMNVDTYKFYKEAYANSTLQMEIRKDIQPVHCHPPVFRSDLPQPQNLFRLPRHVLPQWKHSGTTGWSDLQSPRWNR